MVSIPKMPALQDIFTSKHFLVKTKSGNNLEGLYVGTMWKKGKQKNCKLYLTFK